jgi:hypothetical protein
MPFFQIKTLIESLVAWHGLFTCTPPALLLHQLARNIAIAMPNVVVHAFSEFFEGGALPAAAARVPSLDPLTVACRHRRVPPTSSPLVLRVVAPLARRLSRCA